VMLAAGLGSVAQAGPRKPILMEGKQSLYQRVLARPGAGLRERPDVAVAAESVVPFTVYYVYSHRSEGGEEWAEVGTDSHGTVRGWLPMSELIEWRQSLTVAFRDPLGHDRVLLFRDRESLKTLAESSDLGDYQRLYEEADTGDLPEGSPVVAIQPKGYVDPQESFYLVPIQQHEDVYLGNEQALMLKVTSVPLREAREPPATQQVYSSGVVFVIDSTLSMGPYIKRTRSAVRKVYDALEDAGLADKASFGLVAYRDNPDAAQGLKYLTRTYATLEDGKDPARFFAQVDALEPARASSSDFVEDAYAGIKEAIDGMDWRGHDARYIVLITDAGPRAGSDPLGHTGLDAEALRQLTQDKGVAILVLHLLTSAGADDHVSAAGEYRRLSHYPGIGSFYYGVKMGDVAEFGRVLDTLAAQVTEQVWDAAGGTTALAALEQAPAEDDMDLAALQEKVAKLGYALRLRYLQRHQGEQLPSAFNAWLLDRDFRDPERATVDVRVLLTRDQLSDLQYVLRQVLATAEEGLLSPRSFLDDLKSLAASISRTPEDLGDSTRTTGAEGGNLADLGYMREYIEDLPYRGEVMNLSLETWEEWPAKRQLEFINRLENKLSYYQALHDHTDLWISLDGGPVTGDSVFPIALEMLP